MYATVDKHSQKVTWLPRMTRDRHVFYMFVSCCSAGKPVSDRRCTNWHYLTSSSTSLCSSWWSFLAGKNVYVKSVSTGCVDSELFSYVTVFFCVSGWWWTNGPVSWPSGWVGRSLWLPPTCSAWFMVRLLFGLGLCFALCCRSSIPSSSSSSSTARRWRCCCKNM